MKLKGEAYSKRLEEYSDDTIRLIMECTAQPIEIVLQATAIIADSDNTEADVVRKLKKLRDSK
ncbi:MAG: hypothetical protein J6A50_06655 [Clostridia bacterium]|nr:hypothetical protein [Clostridia bacterium]